MVRSPFFPQKFSPNVIGSRNYNYKFVDQESISVWSFLRYEIRPLKSDQLEDKKNRTPRYRRFSPFILYRSDPSAVENTGKLGQKVSAVRFNKVIKGMVYSIDVSLRYTLLGQ